MTQQTFPISGRKPRVAITRLEGNLVVQPWNRQEISVSAEGPIEVLQQEGDTVTIVDCKSDLTLWVPSIRGIIFPVVTEIVGSTLSRNATIEGAGNVELRDVGGTVSLRKTYGNVELVNVSEVAEMDVVGGNLRAVNIPVLRAQDAIGGNTTLLDVRKQEIAIVGGNLMITGTDTATINTVGGSLDVERVATLLHCTTVGGNCDISHSPEAQISVNTVGGNFYADGAVVTSGMVGGNLRARLELPAGSQSGFNVGGNATITLPEQPNVSIRATVGGNVTAPSGSLRRGGGFVSLVYGDGSAQLSITAGGNVKLLGVSTNPEMPGNSSNSWESYGAAWGDFGREMSREMRRFGREMSREMRENFRY